MTITEKVAYLKGLSTGLKISETTDEGKLFVGIIEAMEEMSNIISDLEETQQELSDRMDEMDDDLGVLERDFYGNAREKDFHYEVECPNCGDTIVLDAEMLEKGEIGCPGCGEKLEFDFDEEEYGCSSCDGDHNYDQNHE